MKKTTCKPLWLVLLFVSSSIFSQVGIGTVTPDPSSILDISSTTQGILAPRMTTSERNAILTPAEGLLVFDTDDNLFYFYDEATWVPLGNAEIRTNYKLVKSIADLSEELIAGGGSVYVLNEDFMYEINGTITFDFPVDLNGAYIEGHDTGEDILINASGSALFSGTKGGRLKDVLINGGGSQLFDINGTGAESLVGYSVIVTNASSIGTLSNLYAVFFEVFQILNSNDGLEASDITSFFLDKVFWTDGNTGSFLTLSGNFGNLQIANGRVVVDSGEVGIDVSANPTITISASMSELDFTGAGTLVVPYTTGTYIGYNFTKDWDVDCPGISLETDNNATGDINLDAVVGVGEVTSFADNVTPTKIVGTTTSNNLFRFTSSGDNKIIYDGKKTRYFDIAATLSCQSGGAGIYIFYIAKGASGSGTATIVAETKVYRRFSTGSDIGAATAMGTIQLAPGDFIEVWAQRYSGTSNLLTVSLNLVAN